MYNFYFYNDGREIGLECGKTSIYKGIDEIKPVWNKEMNLIGMYKYLNYTRYGNNIPYLWLISGRNYYYKGYNIGYRTIKNNKVIFIPNKILTSNIVLERMNIDRMLGTNKQQLYSITRYSNIVIQDIKSKLEGKVDYYTVLYDGSKNSMLLIELLRCRLDASKFIVVFNKSNILYSSDTKQNILDVEQYCKTNKIQYICLDEELDIANISKQYNTPNKLLRWCCYRFNEIPMIKKLKEYLGNNVRLGYCVGNILASDFKGSSNEVNRIAKNIVVNSNLDGNGYRIYPLYHWNSVELWMYMFYKKLPINEEYIKGIYRIRCVNCNGNKINDRTIKNKLYRNEILDADKVTVDMYGKDIKCTLRCRNVLKCTLKDSNIPMKESIKGRNDIVLEWYKVVDVLDAGILDVYKDTVKFTAYNNSSRDSIYKVHAVFKKASMCIACGRCELICPYGCISKKDNNIRIDNCRHCYKCITINPSCFRFKSVNKNISKCLVGDNDEI